jgi:hypothetical protein
MKTSPEKLKAAFLSEAEALFDELIAWDAEHATPDLTEIEEQVLRWRQQIGLNLVEKVLARQETRQPVEKLHCPHCAQEAIPKGLKPKQLETRLGPLVLERSYAYCPLCRQGFFPPGRTTEPPGYPLE